MNTSPYYKAFVAQTLEGVLQSIFKKEEDVLIMISLTNGIYLEGLLIDLKKDDNHTTAICLRTQNEEISYVHMHSIAMVTVKQPKKMVVELSQGAISRPLPSTSNELTVLQLKIWLKNEKLQLGSQIKHINVEALDLKEENNRLNVQDLFVAFKKCIESITKDSLGKEAWLGVDNIVIQQAEKLQLTIEASTLTISIAIHKALPQNLSSLLEEKLLQLL
ncbi:hypothetical protein [Dokdonia sp. Asnod1-B02]|uniref:hypothetical protein n=1 Tax=Dokdonia sp. Asnod1-B02 TaxID=3160573 RepID=UPI003866916E